MAPGVATAAVVVALSGGTALTSGCQWTADHDGTRYRCGEPPVCAPDWAAIAAEIRR